MISLYIPENKNYFNIEKEIAEAGNIKDKQNRLNTLAGLNKIRDYA